jgi:acyl-coenzyme A thioesterase PaaI-like protein
VDAARPGVSDFGVSVAGSPVTGRRPATTGEADTAASDAPLARGAPDPRLALADAVRRITAASIGRPLAEDTLARAAAELSAVADRLEQAAEPGRRPRPQPDPAGHPQDFFPTSPVIGFANPLAPPVVVEAIGGELRGTAWFDYPYEGPPTCVHGGVIAMVFDELLGAANIVAGSPAMTGTLTVRYRRPTPIRTALHLEARCTGRSGRKVSTWGGIYLDEELLAEAEGIFVELSPERFLQIVTANADPSEVLEQLESGARPAEARPAEHGGRTRNIAERD